MWLSFALRSVEVWLTSRLLASPAFHRMVRGVHRRVHNLQHGPPPEEMGGTKLDTNGRDFKQFFAYFKEEIRDQLRGKPPKKIP